MLEQSVLGGIHAKLPKLLKVIDQVIFDVVMRKREADASDADLESNSYRLSLVVNDSSQRFNGKVFFELGTDSTDQEFGNAGVIFTGRTSDRRDLTDDALPWFLN